MLVLSRRECERFRIGDDIEILVVRISDESVRLGISAPQEMSILRNELQDEKASNLAVMNHALKRRDRAAKALKAANDWFRARFPVGCRIEFDRGDMRLLGGTVVGFDLDFTEALVRPDVADVGSWLGQFNGLVRVPWALLFTPESAAEMHAVRDQLLQD